MKLQRSRSLQLIAVLFSVTCLFTSLGARAAAADGLQGKFACSLDGESSQIELALATAQQRVPVHGGLELEIQGSEARVSELAFDTDPILFRGSETLLEFALDPSSLAVAVPPFISHLVIPVSLLVTTDPASPPARIEASLQINLGETLIGLLSGSLPGDPKLGFFLPVSCGRDVSLLTVKVYGTRLAIDGIGNDIIMSSCWCVQDSPESPCTCLGPRVRIPGTQILKFEPSNRQSVDGHNLSVATIAKDTRVIVGRDPLPVNAGIFVEKTDVFAAIKLGSKVGGVRGTAGAILGAFLVGYELGTKIDQATGASTALGDLLWDLLR